MAGACAAPPPADETDKSNYQAEYNHFGGGMDPIDHNVERFSVGYERFTSGALIVTLDTSLVRTEVGPPYYFRLADSILVRGLAKTERFTIDCQAGGHWDRRILGLLRDSIRHQLARPRLAWMIDTAAGKLRGIKTDSLSCAIRGDPE